MAQGAKCDCKCDWLWVRSLLEEMKYLYKFIFPFLRSSVQAKRGVEFRHSTRNALALSWHIGAEAEAQDCKRDDYEFTRN